MRHFVVTYKTKQLHFENQVLQSRIGRFWEVGDDWLHEATHLAEQVAVMHFVGPARCTFILKHPALMEN